MKGSKKRGRGSPDWLMETQMLEPASLAFPRLLASSWTGSGAGEEVVGTALLGKLALQAAALVTLPQCWPLTMHLLYFPSETLLGTRYHKFVQNHSVNKT